MRLIIQNGIAAFAKELRECSPDKLDVAIEMAAAHISMLLTTMRKESAPLEVQTLQPGVEVQAEPLLPGVQSLMLKGAMKGLAEANTITDAHRIFVTSISKGLQLLDAPTREVAAS